MRACVQNVDILISAVGFREFGGQGGLGSQFRRISRVVFGGGKSLVRTTCLHTCLGLPVGLRF